VVGAVADFDTDFVSLFLFFVRRGGLYHKGVLEMKEVSNIASNLIFTEKDDDDSNLIGEVRGVLELCIAVSEPTYKVDDVGIPVRYRQTETLRFSGTDKSMRQVAEYITERLKELEEALERINKPKRSHKKEDTNA